MLSKINNKAFILALTIVLLSSAAFAEVLVLDLNGNTFTTEESVKIFGHAFNNDLSGINSTRVQIYLDTNLKTNLTTDTEGYYEYYLTNISIGNHTITSSTNSSEQKLTFSVINKTQDISYQILADTLSLPITDPTLSFTVKKYLGKEIVNDNYTYKVFYENGTLYQQSTGISNNERNITLPAQVGNYKIIIDGQKSLTASVIVYSLKFKITDSAGNQKDIFKPNSIAYFEVQGFSNGQSVTNATVTAIVTDPAGTKKTVTFTQNSGIFKGNTNVTQTTPIQLKTGEYNVEFMIKDDLNNEQKSFGFFTVHGLNINLELIEKKPYRTGETAEFDIIIKDLSNGELLTHESITYSTELIKEGKFYDITNSITLSNSTDQSKTSKFTLSIPPELEDGDYFLKVKAVSNGKEGKTSEFLKISDTDVFIDITDNYGNFRHEFKPGELAKLRIESSENLTSVEIEIKNENDQLQQSLNNSPLGNRTVQISFNAPTTLGGYLATIKATTSNGKTIIRDRWFNVQNYFSFMDIKNLNGTHKFMHKSQDSFLGELVVFDIATGETTSITNFITKFNKIVNEQTGTEYTNFVAVKNTTQSSEGTGRAVYKITPPTLTEGIYRIEYTLVDNIGNSFRGEGWFGISAFDVNVQVKDSSGQNKKIFSMGDSINVTVELSSAENGTATLHREFFEPLTFNISNGRGNIFLTSSNNQLPAEEGFYPFAIEVNNDQDETGLGEGFFEIKNLNIKSISLRNNGIFTSEENIIADITIEKSGTLISNANISLTRLVRTNDKYDYNLNEITSSANLTNNVGRTTLIMNPQVTLPPGHYFAEIKVEDTNGNILYEKFGFEIKGDNIIITLNDEDKTFSSTDTIEINVKVTDQNNNPQANVSINLTGLLNFNTWAPTQTNKQATTSSNGIATLTLSAANFNPSRYAPILQIGGISNQIIGFGESEFEIKPFDAQIYFSSGSNTLSASENIVVNVNITGDATITPRIKDRFDTEQTIEYSYSNKVLTIKNSLQPGEYFLDVDITLSSKTVTKTIWFEVTAPWLHIEPLMNPIVSQNGSVNIIYDSFIFSVDGKQPTNTSVNITSIENMWTGETINLSTIFEAQEDGTYQFNITQYNLSRGDYFLNIKLPANPLYDNSLYFRVDKNIQIFVEPEVEENSNNVSITINTTGLTNPIIYLERYTNFDTFAQTFIDTNVSSGANSNFLINNLQNGFYEANLRIESGNEVYYWNTFFEIRVKEVTITAPDMAMVGNSVTFNVSTQNSNTFWLMDPFTQTILIKQTIEGETQINWTFDRPGRYMYSYGNTKRDAFHNAREIFIDQTGFNIEWPHEGNRYILSSGEFKFNVTSDLANTPLQLILKNHFTGTKKTVEIGNTSQTPGNKAQFSFDLDGELGLSEGPHDVILILQDGSAEPPKDYFFIDIFPSQYDIWAWNENWEYKSGEQVRIKIEIYDILNNWMKTNPDSVAIVNFNAPDGTQESPTVNLDGDTFLINTDETWSTGMYFGEINVTKGSVTNTIPIDFFIKGEDNLDIFWHQNRWDISSNDNFTLSMEVREEGRPATNISVSLVEFGTRPKDFNSGPVDKMDSITGNYVFSNNGKTNSNGEIEFTIDIGQTNLTNGGYTGRVKVGSQYVWFDFNIQNYQVDAYTESWEYGEGDTIELIVRARDITNWNPLNENGNVTIQSIRLFDFNNNEGGFVEPQEVNISDFGLTENLFTIYNGEALIEMRANLTALGIDHPVEFEVELELNLENSGSANAWTWFKQSNTEKASITIIDKTGETPSAYFPGQTYIIKLSNIGENTTISRANLWGPRSINLDPAQAYTQNSSYRLNFTTPQMSGWYSVEVEIEKEGGFREHMFTDFQIGSETEIHSWTESNAIPGINFTVHVELFGKGQDPWCEQDPYCTQNWEWFGPLGNKTISFKGIKDLETFTFIDKSNLGISATTQNFEMFNEGNPDDHGHELRPGMALITLNPTQLGLEIGKEYDLIFSYINDEGTETTGNSFIRVENFHVAISKKTENIEPNSQQSVWTKTTYLNGTPITDCNISFSSIYNEKDFSLVKTISIAGTTDSNGTYEFTYDAPSLPGYYLITGEATCLLDGVITEQETSYFIEVGSRSLDVDMKTRFTEDENIKLSITTKDGFGNPKSQKVLINLFHDFYDYPNDIYSLGGTDCVALDAALQTFSPMDPSQTTPKQNFHEVYTDSNGVAEVEICPLPNGEYMIDVFPMFEFETFDNNEPDMHGGDMFGFFADFIVSPGIITVNSEVEYQVGDMVTLNITASDEEGNPLNGTIIAADAVMEAFGSGEEKELLIFDLNGTIDVINGRAIINYTVPSQAPNDFNESQIYNVTVGPVDTFLMIEDANGNKYTHYGIQYTVKKNSLSQATAPTSVKSNNLIDLSVVTTNDSRYKVQAGVFFLKDNSEKMKEWFIEGGVFFQDAGDGTSNANLKILSPKEPGDYLLAFPIFELSSTEPEMIYATELLIIPIEVTLDLVNITGKITESDGTTAINNALIRIGKKEIYSNSTGEFSLQMPKGKKSIEIENKVSSELKQTLSAKHNFANDSQINISFYRITLNGELQQTFFNISQSSTLDAIKLRINTTINNTDNKEITNATIKAITISDDEIKRVSLTGPSSGSVFFKNLYAGFRSDIYKLKIKLKANESNWDSTGNLLINGVSINSDLGATLIKEYRVETYMTAGNGIDDDRDGSVDEEIDNYKDDDGDGLVDEDLEGQFYFEWCGNGFCSAEEVNNCNLDCAVGNYCGDNVCDDGEENWCFEDCSDTVDTCTNYGMCDFSTGMFCNWQGIEEPASWCQDNCSVDACWACGTTGDTGQSECELAGCSIDIDMYNSSMKWCFKQENCTMNTPWACENQTSCVNVGGEWEFDIFDPNIGWCQKPWNCEYECGACMNQTSCENSATDSCNWRNDEWGSWCEWEGGFFPVGGDGDSPPQEGDGGNESSGMLLNLTLIGDAYSSIKIEDEANNQKILYDFNSQILFEIENNTIINYMNYGTPYFRYNIINYSENLNISFENQIYNNSNSSKITGITRKTNKSELMNTTIINITAGQTLFANFTLTDNTTVKNLTLNITSISGSINECEYLIKTNTHEELENIFNPSFTANNSIQIINYNSLTGNITEIEILCQNNIGGSITPNDGKTYYPFTEETFNGVPTN